MTLRLVDFKGRVVQTFPVATGRNYGDKEKEGDCKTPEGVFFICSIEDASEWTHDFGDGRGEVTGCYGSTFMRLVTPGYTGIGIHGTHDPMSIGTRASEGCIRLENNNLDKLVKKCRPGMAVVITPSYLDVLKNGHLEDLKQAIVESQDSLLNNALNQADSLLQQKAIVK